MRVTFTIPQKDVSNFEGRCSALISKVGNGSRKALKAACEEISAASLAQVPRDTETLAASHYYEIHGGYRTGWDAEIGYGKPDYVNPKSGKPASSYMVKVHEDLDAVHPVGKAKFLEDPIREYTRENFPRTVHKYLEEALE